MVGGSLWQGDLEKSKAEKEKADTDSERTAEASVAPTTGREQASPSPTDRRPALSNIRLGAHERWTGESVGEVQEDRACAHPSEMKTSADGPRSEPEDEDNRAGEDEHKHHPR